MTHEQAKQCLRIMLADASDHVLRKAMDGDDPQLAAEAALYAVNLLNGEPSTREQARIILIREGRNVPETAAQNRDKLKVRYAEMRKAKDKAR